MLPFMRAPGLPALALLIAIQLALAQVEEDDRSPSVIPVIRPPPRPPGPPGPGVAQGDRSCRTISALSPASCNPSDTVDSFSIFNRGRVKLDIYKLLANGERRKAVRLTLVPGRTLSADIAICAGDVLTAVTKCGLCLAKFRVSAASQRRWVVASEKGEGECPPPAGRWTTRRDWPLIPITIVNLPDGRLYGFAASDSRVAMTGRRGKFYHTQGAIYNPRTNSLRRKDLDGHDLICAAMTMLPDGSIFAGGGGRDDNSYKVSTYNPFTQNWTRHADTQLGHWYGTAVVTKENEVFVALGTDRVTNTFERANANPEVSKGFNFDRPWRFLGGANMEGKHGEGSHYYPQMQMMRNGNILSSGTINQMYTISTTGSGTISPSGLRNVDRAERESWGTSTIYFEKDKLIALGGTEGWTSQNKRGDFVYKRVIEINMRNPNRITTRQVAPMWFNRTHQNTVALPSGEVYVVGGQYSDVLCDDTYTVYNPEIWNPKTNKWTTVWAEHARPRNYHSTAILLQDGRVWSGGGGLCGDRINDEPSSEIYSPAYLFNQDGSRASRPRLINPPATVQRGDQFWITVGGAGAKKIHRFSWVKHCAVTHSVSPEARQITAQVVNQRSSGATEQYRIKVIRNPHIMLRGYWFLFALNAEGVPSVAANIKIE